MAYPDHFLCTFGGLLGPTSGEIWSCGIRMVVTGADSDSFDPNAWVDGNGKDAIAAFHTRVNTRIALTTTLVWAKMNRIAPDGTYADPVTHEYLWPTPLQGNAPVTSALPYQVSLAVTWHTNVKTRGAGSKGRIYLPTPVVTGNATTGLFDVTQATSIAGSAALLLNALDDSVGVTGQIRPAIVSNVGGGQANQIDGCSVDNRLDIIRRRGNNLAPVRTLIPVSY